MEQYKVELILAALLAISEVLALSPLKSNSIFQMIKNVLGAVVAKKEVKKEE